jgi:hypothetical protein
VGGSASASDDVNWSGFMFASVRNRGLKAPIKTKTLIAALKRCATQKLCNPKPLPPKTYATKTAVCFSSLL